jgi:putative transposase
VAEAAGYGIQTLFGYMKCEVVELNVQPDHVRLIAMVPPKVAISELMGRVKGQTVTRLFKLFPELRRNKYWGNHFWAQGYCVDTVGVNAEMSPKYVKYQEKKERTSELMQLGM